MDEISTERLNNLCDEKFKEIIINEIKENIIIILNNTEFKLNKSSEELQTDDVGKYLYHLKIYKNVIDNFLISISNACSSACGFVINCLSQN